MAATLEGKVAIVTGAGSGIGRATARELARRGAVVTVADIVAESAQRTADDVAAAGGTALAVQADVSSEADVVVMIERTVEAFGGIDVLHNNAADTSLEQGARDTDVVGIPMEAWDRAMSVNVRSMVLTCKYAIPHMLGRGGGSIINMSSGSALGGSARQVAYSASKAAVISLTRSIAVSHGKRGIRCNAIAPGFIQIPEKTTRNVSPAVIELLAEETLLPRLGEVDDIAHVVAFLASDEAGFVTGQVVSVDGGLLGHSPMYRLERKLVEG